MDSLFLCHPQIVLCGSHNTVGIWIPYLPFENRKHIVKDARMKRRQLSMFDRQLDRHGLHFKWSVVRVWVFWIRSSSPLPAIWLGRDVRGECSTKTMGMIEFGYAVLIRGSVHMSILLYVHKLFLSPFPLSTTKVAPSRYQLCYLSSLFWCCIHLWRWVPAK